MFTFRAMQFIYCKISPAELHRPGVFTGADSIFEITIFWRESQGNNSLKIKDMLMKTDVAWEKLSEEVSKETGIVNYRIKTTLPLLKWVFPSISVA